MAAAFRDFDILPLGGVFSKHDLIIFACCHMRSYTITLNLKRKIL